MTIYNSITELVGKTPVIKLNSIVPEGSADVYVKLEAFNPGSCLLYTSLPCGTTGSLSPTFVPARVVALAVKLPYTFTLCE